MNSIKNIWLKNGKKKRKTQFIHEREIKFKKEEYERQYLKEFENYYFQKEKQKYENAMYHFKYMC